jgi:hypothetical protein
MAGRCGFGERPLRLPEWLKGFNPPSWYVFELVLAMGGLSVASTSWAEPEPSTPGPVPTEEATTGETTTVTTPATTPTTSSVPLEIEGPAALPSEQEDAL